MKFERKNFFFTDETKIDLEPPNDQIRLGSKKKKEINEGKEEALKLVTVSVKKTRILNNGIGGNIILWP